MIRIKNIKVKTKNQLKKELIKILNNNEFEYKIVKESIDARHNKLFYIYTVDVEIDNEDKYLSNNIIKTPNEEYIVNITGTKKLNYRPIIIGSGPAGLFLAYMLSLYGYKPIIYERGEDIDARVKAVEEFWKNGNLNPNTNIQFGLGGAGTFSDGKLNTLVKDKNNRCKKVFEIFKDNGALENIMYEKNPHIGTDILRIVVKNMKEKIIENGGEFHFNSLVTDINVTDKINSIIVNNEVIKTDILFLAIGHSARDTFYMLNRKGINMENKPFAVGLRIEHPRTMINKSQYNDPNINASYKLTYNTKNRGIYTFCMCPGGYVVNASSENERLVINGMSNNKRDSLNSNSAIVVTVNELDYGTNLFDGVKFQEKLESIAYRLGNGKIPVQLFIDYKNNKMSNSFGEYEPCIKGNYTFSNLNELFNNDINNSLKEAIINFGTKINGFDRDDAILSGVESRTSSPIRIIRDDNYETNIKGIYPIGEGAGYAGGITTSAMDALKVFEIIISKYKPFK